MNGEIVTLAHGKLYALVNTFPLDGRVTSYRPAPVDSLPRPRISTSKVIERS
jgi:hypothetical protein